MEPWTRVVPPGRSLLPLPVAAVVILSAVALSLLTGVAHADGKAFAIPQLQAPAIPRQQAMIVWRDGQETLIVQSNFQTESPHLGWVLPLPSPPSELIEVRAGFLDSMRLALRGRVIEGGLFWGRLALVTLGAIVLIALFVWLAPRKPYVTGISLGCLGLAVSFGGCMVLFSMMGTKSAGDGPVVELGAHRVGSYEATVLRVQEPEGLSSWLRTNGLATLDGRDEEVVSDYIRRKWVFVVMRLTRDGDRWLTPHPIAARFPTDRPVYPMKLTGLQGGEKTFVDLIVVASDQAEIDGFRTVLADAFDEKPPWTSDLGEMSSEGVKTLGIRVFGSRTTRVSLGHPDAAKFLWPGCVISRLQAELGTEEMEIDIEVSFRALTPVRFTARTPQDHRGMVQVAISASLAVLVLAAAFAARGRRRPSRLSLVVLAVIAAGGAALPIQAWQEPSADEPSSDEHSFTASYSAGDMVPRDNVDRAGWTDEQWARFFAQESNPYSTKPIRMEPSPGNFGIVRHHGSTFLAVYDLDTIPRGFLRIDAPTKRYPEIERPQPPDYPLHPFFPDAATTAPSDANAPAPSR